MATWVNDVFPGFFVRAKDERQEPARSQGTSISIDVRISVYPLGNDHPLAHLFGKYADDPMWLELEAIMDRNQANEE